MAAGEQIEERIGERLAARELSAAATEALRGYGPQILGYLAAVLRDREAAREAFADFSELLWRTLDRFAGQSSFRTWAYGIACNVARRTQRQHQRRRTRRLMTSEISRIAEQVRSTASFLGSGARTRLERMRESLDLDEHTLLVLRIDRGLPWKDIAQILSAPGAPVDDAAARKRFERLKSRLRELAQADRRRE